MTKARFNSVIGWRRAVLPAVLTSLVVVGMVPIARAFKIGVPGVSPPIHENITYNAMTAVMPQADPMFIGNVRSGVYNTDFSHHIAPEFHFDNSTAGNGNGGFTNGFRTIYQMLSLAVSEATVCDANAVCNVNPLFLNPQHGSFGDLAEDIGATYGHLTLNDGCLNELACPSADFAANSAWMGAEMLPALLVTTDPDPDEVVVSLFEPLNIQVENFGDKLAEGRSNLETLLGSHCRPRWAGGMCFDRLEDMAPLDDNFQKLAGHLRILQYEYWAYYAWQHLGHAFHTTQDFFAHSNYVELAAGRKGPPCDPRSYQAATICDAPLDASSGRWNAIRLPTDGLQSQLPALNVAGFAATFSSVDATLNNLPSIFGDKNFNHLQTGYYPCGSDPDPVGNTGGAAPYNLGFLYCHTTTPSGNSSAGMNKDKHYEPGDELNRQNFDWAAVSAQRTSVVLFETFLFSLLGPASSNYISKDSANAASQRVGEMAWLSRGGTTGLGANAWQLGPGGKTAAGIITSNTSNLAGTTQAAALSAAVCPTVDGKSCVSARPSGSPPPLMDLVTVTSYGTPLAGATVSVSGQPTFATVTNASGVALVSHLPCFPPGSVVPQIGSGVPVRVPVPCGGTVSMTGYQSTGITLP